MTTTSPIESGEFYADLEKHFSLTNTDFEGLYGTSVDPQFGPEEVLYADGNGYGEFLDPLQGTDNFDGQPSPDVKKYLAVGAVLATAAIMASSITRRIKR